jgi:hypothetical protein
VRIIEVRAVGRRRGPQSEAQALYSELLSPVPEEAAKIGGE